MKIIWVNKNAKLLIIIAIIFLLFCVAIIIGSILSFKALFGDTTAFNLILSNISSIFSVILIIGVIIFLLYILRIISLNNKKVKLNSVPNLKKILNIDLISYKKKLVNNELVKQKDFYYRDLPCNKDIKRVFWICYQYGLSDNPSGFIQAVLLELILKNKICNISNNSEPTLDLTLFKKYDYEYEAMLLDIFKEAAKDSKNLNKKDFQDWFINNGKKLLDWYSYVLIYTEETLKADCKISNVKIEQNTLIVIKSDELRIEVNEEIKQEALNLYGLKNFLNDFSIIKERIPEEVNMFEYYLIYANILGISEKIEKYFDKIYPDFVKCLGDLKILINIDEDGYLNIK